MRVFLIETSSERGLIALVENSTIVYQKELPFGYQQSKYLMPELEAAFALQTIRKESLDCIGVGIGPGSYTGIRMGVSVAKSLAYSWNLPLIGVSTLNAFVPAHENVTFAAILDAKMGGAYFLKGTMQNSTVHYLSKPEVSPLNELRSHLQDSEVLVTPYQASLKIKLDQLYPEAKWRWEERAPSAVHLAAAVQTKFQKQEWSLNGQLELLYLRQTEAEREKERKQKIN